MNFPALPTSAVTLPSRSRIKGLESIWCWLRLRRGRSLFSLLKNYLYLTPHGGLLHLQQSIIKLGGNKIPDIHLEHAQVKVHLNLLKIKLRAKHGPLYEKTGDLCHQLSPLPQVQKLLSQPLTLFPRHISSTEHL